MKYETEEVIELYAKYKNSKDYKGSFEDYLIAYEGSDMGSIINAAKNTWEETREENALIIEGLVIKMKYYLDDQAREEFRQSLDKDHQIVLHVVLNHSSLLKK